MLASQTGLSKNQVQKIVTLQFVVDLSINIFIFVFIFLVVQVSNWFINARVRLWKPMIEEMYKEEFAESSTESDQLLTREGVGDSAEDLD